MTGGETRMPTSAANPYLPVTLPPAPVDPDSGLPLLWEEEDYETGESNIHVLTDEILHVCLQAFFANQPDVQVFSNLNLLYTKHPDENTAPYISPDLMAVRPASPLPRELASYRIGTHGPAPFLVAEVLSERSYQQRDLRDKIEIYAKLGVAEYVVVDVTGRFLSERLMLRRLQPDRSWLELRDRDGGVTSQTEFRLVVEADGQLRVIDTSTGRKLIRPHEAESRARELERRVQQLEAELARKKDAPQADQ